MAGSLVKVFPVTVIGGSTYDDNEIDLVAEFGREAEFLEVLLLENADVKCRINGNNDAIFTILGTTGGQTFQRGDIHWSSISFDNSASGGSFDVSLQVICGR